MEKPLKKSNTWAHALSSDERETVKPFVSTIASLLTRLGKESGGIHLIATFLRMQVQPLRARVHPMWEVQGVNDPTRLSSAVLSDEEVMQKVRAITSLRAADPCNVKCPVVPYGSENPLPEVSSSLVCRHLCFACFSFTRIASFG